MVNTKDGQTCNELLLVLVIFINLGVSYTIVDLPYTYNVYLDRLPIRFSLAVTITKVVETAAKL